MKKIYLCLLLLATSFVFTACGTSSNIKVNATKNLNSKIYFTCKNGRNVVDLNEANQIDFILNLIKDACDRNVISYDYLKKLHVDEAYCPNLHEAIDYAIDSIGEFARGNNIKGECSLYNSYRYIDNYYNLNLESKYVEYLDSIKENHDYVNAQKELKNMFREEKCVIHARKENSSYADFDKGFIFEFSINDIDVLNEKDGIVKIKVNYEIVKVTGKSDFVFDPYLMYNDFFFSEHCVAPIHGNPIKDYYPTMHCEFEYDIPVKEGERTIRTEPWLYGDFLYE